MIQLLLGLERVNKGGGGMSWVLHGYVLNFRPLRPILLVNFDGGILLVE